VRCVSKGGFLGGSCLLGQLKKKWVTSPGPGPLYILQEMTMGVTKLENSLVEISQDMELDQRCPLGPPSRCFSLFTTPFYAENFSPLRGAKGGAGWA